jgi:hypothetical protein
VVVDPIAGPSLDIAYDRAPSGIVDVTARPTVRAHDVVMVNGLAGDVGVLTGRQIESFDGVQVGQDVQGPEDRRPADAEAPSMGVCDQIGRGERTVLRSDEVGDGLPGAGSAISGVVEGSLECR